MTKTNEEIQALKDNWAKDPCWEIEDTPGFEDHKVELLTWRNMCESEINKRSKEREAARHNFVREQTGVSDIDIANSISTFAEIERMVSSQDEYIGTFASNYEIVMAELQMAQIRATLLQAAQLKRIADAIEQRNEDDASDVNLDFMTKLYKGE